MERWNSDIFKNINIDEKLWRKELILQIKLGKLDLLLSNVCKDIKIASRIFTFIESKYSFQIEGIYTTLFDNVNTDINSKKQHHVAPIISSLLNKNQIIDQKEIVTINNVINKNQDQSKRWNDAFGIYQGTKNKIYQPPLSKEEVKSQLNKLFKKIKNDKTMIDYIITHIFFEKIHPFIDGNGRIGRLILQKQLINQMHFSSIIPISWSFNKNNSMYYQIFELKNNSILKSINIFLNLIEEAINISINFTKDLELFFKINQKNIMLISNKITKNLARTILMSLQCKRIDLEEKYHLNPRTIDKIFITLNKLDLPFNIKIVSKQKIYWNIELEMLINKHFA